MSLKRLLVYALVVLVLITGCAKRSTAPSDTKILSLIKEIPIVGNPFDISTTNSELYVAADQGGLTVIDTNTWQSKWWTVMVPGGADATLVNVRKASVVPEHDFLFLGEFVGGDKIRIIKTSNPDSLELIDSITGGTDALQSIRFSAISNPTGADVVEGFFSAARTFYYCKYDGELYLGSTWDISATATVSGFDVTDDLVVLAVQQRGLAIYDRDTQDKLSEFALSGQALAVKVSGNYAYVACRQEGFQIVDISNPSAPKLVGRFDTTGYATTIELKDNLAVVSSGGGGVYLFDVSNPAKPALKENLSSAGYTNNAIFYKDKVVVSARDKGILVYNIR